MSIAETKSNSVVNIKKINGSPYKTRLMEMGFVPGRKIKIERNSSFNPLVVIVGESRYSLNKELANDILVDLGN
ncbi:MAG: FeoA family protein [Spirochaetota bacterium]